MKHLKNSSLLLMLMVISSCSYISGPDGMFPETKDKFFDEKLSPDLKLPSTDVAINKDDHYPPISDGIPAAEVQDIPAPRQIFSSGESNEVQLRRLGELMWVYVETLPSTSWPITKNYFEASSMSILDADPDAGIMHIQYSDALNLKITIEHGIKEASTEIFLSSYNSDEGVSAKQDPEFIQKELEKIVQFFASSASSFSGTSLAAQNLNDRKKAKIFNVNDQTIIELNLGFDRAWSAVSRALEAGNITSNDIDRDNGIFLVSYSVESDSRSWFSFLNFNDEEINDSLLLGESAEFRIVLESKDDKTNIIVESLEGTKEEANSLLSKINELLS
ncbi:outer membrane protein assembly factor BamC [Gammaproteobacteria bacterium]|jgi:outer membrane protein assembly factor BamC|nr:outer membrane protein assembly factor BamC [Gammaproteobacteria bacterium]MDA9965171.1 outer membrane protein assembly factor BamC [Gammaproteobacteria bacterium]MDC0906358.1 outer membrane protein assembly factor BamC [Gammaproteobacteria bacterium]MDC0918746.1 outer membrane protein assembly factor BamC [Gammaproteobacteria bacterium]